MKPVSVTVGISFDAMAIEACFEQSMMSDLGKADELSDPTSLSAEHFPTADQRDDATLVYSHTSGSDHHHYQHKHSSSRNEKREGFRDEPSASREQPDPSPSAASRSRSQSDDNFIEAEFEMVLESAEDPSEHEKRKRSGQVEGIDGCIKQGGEVLTDEEEEERVVVWCADTSSESGDSEAEGMYPIEEEEENPNDSMEGSTNPSLSLGNNLVTELTNESEESMISRSTEWHSDEEMRSDSAASGGGQKGSSDCSEEDETAVPSLSVLINRRNWHQVIERVREISCGTDVSVEERVSCLGRDLLGDSFLHEICKNQPTVEVVRLWLEINKDDVRRHGIEGHLPLHYACAFGASVAVIDMLVEAFPESLNRPDDQDNMLPLHFACRQAAKLEVIDFLLETQTSPDAIFTQDNHNMTPMDYAMNIQDAATRDQTIKCIQNALKHDLSNISGLLADSRTSLREEQEKVKALGRKVRLEKEAKEKKARDDHSLLEYALNRVATLEKSETERKGVVESLFQNVEKLESQLAEAQQQLSVEKNRLYIEKTRELESILKLEKCKTSALEQSLVAKQEMIDNEKERTKDAEQRFSEMRILLQNERLKTKHLGESLNIEKERSRRLEEEQAIKVATAIPRAHGNDPPLGRIDAPADSDTDAENARRGELDRIRSETEALLQANREAVRALELGNAKKQELLDAQQEKVELLERTRREKESLLQKSQETMKALQESIERKLSLQKAEEGKIRQLDNLRHKKREMIDSEEEQVRKLDYLLGRKQALLELEQMKEKTLKQTIAQKEALLESEMAKMKDLEAIYAEKDAMLVAEQNIVKSLQASKKEKEGLLRIECELVNKLQLVNYEKETLLQKKQKIQEETSRRVRSAEGVLREEKTVLAATEKVLADKEALLIATDETLKSIEKRMTKKSSLMMKEQNIAESMERFRQRRREVAAQGRLYSLVDTTLSISHLVKEALLAKKYEQRLVEEEKIKAGVVMRKTTLPTSESLLRKALSLEGKRCINHIAGYFGIFPKWRKCVR